MEKRHSKIPVALTIAGSDSGGGAGVQADLKTFAALGLHGTSAITCVTAQNPRAVLGVQACKPDVVGKQIEAVFAELAPRAVKTGMLWSGDIIRIVAKLLRDERRPPLVVDPVMVATSGAVLLRRAAVKVLENELLPLATLVTPNVPEAELLARMPIRTLEHARRAAQALQEKYGCTVLLKGGHLRTGRFAVDVLRTPRSEHLLRAPFVRGVKTHGGGCTYAAAIAGYLARGHDLEVAVQKAKKFVTAAIRRSQWVGRHPVLNLLWRKA